MSQTSQYELLDLALDFCARVTASATHEIKNELAVINEQTRLVQELLALTHQGREPNLEKLEEIIGRVIVRVGQADQAVRRLNSFAHSADLDRRQADAGRELTVIAPLFARTATRRGASLAMDQDIPQAPVEGRPLLLEQAIWACLEAVVASGRAGEVKLSLERSPGQVSLRFASGSAETPQEPPSEVLQPLGAKAHPLDGGGMELILPLAGERGRENAG